MQVFISHSSEDLELANQLAREIRNAGMEAWSLDSVSPGANWAAEQGRALEGSEAMVVLLTRGAKNSTSITKDVQFALTEGHYRGRLIPVLVNLPTFEAGTDVPWVLLRFNTIPVSGSPPDFSPLIDRLFAFSQDDANATT